jgi:uncharacterized protein
MESTRPASHIVDVFELARSGAAAPGVVAIKDLPRLAEGLAADGGDLQYELRGFLDEQARPSAMLTVRGPVLLECDRCGEPASVDLDTAAQFFFVSSEAELHRAPIDESDTDALIGSTQFDLLQLVEDEAILALPLSPRHLQCQPASAEAPDEMPARASPFAALGQLKVRKH